MTPTALPIVGAVYRGGQTIGARDGILEHLRGRRLLVVGFLSLRDIGMADRHRPTDTDVKLARGKSLDEINAGRAPTDDDAIRYVDVRVTLRGRVTEAWIDLAEWGGELLEAPAS